MFVLQVCLNKITIRSKNLFIPTLLQNSLKIEKSSLSLSYINDFRKIKNNVITCYSLCKHIIITNNIIVILTFLDIFILFFIKICITAIRQTPTSSHRSTNLYTVVMYCIHTSIFRNMESWKLLKKMESSIKC